MGVPRIGRADRIAQIAQELEAEVAFGLPPGWPAVTRMLVTTPPPKAPTRASLAAVLEAAQQLADLLQPLPAALHELGIRINRHCGAKRAPELARAVDLVDGRTFELFLAILRLRDAADSGDRAPKSAADRR